MSESFEERHPDFWRIVPRDAAIQRAAGGFGMTEGPLWNGDHLLFSDMPNSRIVRYTPLAEGPDVRTFRFPSNIANGLTFDRQHRLIACEGVSRRLTRTEADGSITVLAERYKGKRINSPNDVVVASHGAIYFSDPFWGHLFRNPAGPSVAQEDRELDFCGVFCLTPDGSLFPVAEGFVVPNGLAFSPDERILYVDDSARRHIRAFDVRPDGSLANDRVFARLDAPERGAPDGMKVDVEGNIYCTGPGGVWILRPDGTVLGRIMPPEGPPTNVGWADADGKTLYMTMGTSVYRVRLTIMGVPVHVAEETAQSPKAG